MADYCACSQIEHYLALRTSRKIYQRRKVDILKPLFPGYIFVQFDRPLRALIFRSAMVVKVLKVDDQEGLLYDLKQIRRALEADPFISSCPSVQRGERVQILSGPFSGLEGLVSVIKGQARVVLNVDIIGQGVSVEADMNMLGKY